MAERWVFLNGEFCLEKHAAIPIHDRGFLFGDGIFTTIRVHDGKCELLKGHLQRLKRQAEFLHLDLGAYSWEWISELIRINEGWEGTWRLKIIVTAKEEQSMRQVGCILATLHPYQAFSLTPCSLNLFPQPIESPLAHIKSLSYLNHLYVREFAHQKGYTDAITHTSEGFLLETGCANLFWIYQGTCWIPDPKLPYLKGVFLQSMLPHLDFSIQFIQTTFEQLPASAHVYICNALHHVRPVEAIDHCVFSRNQQIEDRLQQSTFHALRGNDEVCMLEFNF